MFKVKSTTVIDHTDSKHSVNALLVSDSGREYYLGITPSEIVFDDVPQHIADKLAETNSKYEPLEFFDRVDGIDYYKSGIIDGTELAFGGSIVEDIIDELIKQYNL